MKPKFLIILFLLTLAGTISLKSFAQDDDLITRLKSQLFFYRTQNAIQTVEVQTDKTLYRPGENIWFKCYVINQLTKHLSLNSLSINLLLADEGGNTVTERAFPLENGRASGYLQLPQDLANGHYRLLAYTPEMASEPPANIFCGNIVVCRPENINLIGNISFTKEVLPAASREIALLKLTDLSGKPASGKKFEYSLTAGSKELVSGKGKTDQNGRGEITLITPSPDTDEPAILTVDLQSDNAGIKLSEKVPLLSEKINLSFYPEGGKLVAGIPQLVIFEATDQLGNPVSVAADILDDDGTVITNIQTLQPGLGAFHLLNNNPGPLTLQITSESGKGQKTMLPLPDHDAIALSVKKNNGTNLGVMVAPSPDNSNTKYTIVAVSAGEIVWANEFVLNQAGLINIPLGNFHHDIAELAIFDRKGKLLGQRIVYTGKGEYPGITLQTDQPSYRIESEGTVKIRITGNNGNPVRSELNLSLTDTTTLMPSCCTAIQRINQGLEKPLPPDISSTEDGKKKMDYLLIANKIKGIDWSKITSIDPAKPAPIYQNTTRVSGTVLGNDGKPIPNAMVFISTSSLQQYNGRSNEKGDFEINIPARLDKKLLNASASDCDGKGSFNVVLNKNFREEIEIYLKNNPRISDWDFLAGLTAYLEANPDFEKTNPANRSKAASRNSTSPMSNYLTGATSMMDVINSIRPFELTDGKIIFRGANSIPNREGALIVVDGQKKGADASILNTIPPKEVADVKVWIDPSEIARFTSSNPSGVIEITLKREEDSSGNRADRFAPYENKTVGDFVPTPIGNEKFKLITTPLWVPNIFTDERGEATVKFSLGRVKSGFRLTATGFTDQGEWVETSAIIEVK